MCGAKEKEKLKIRDLNDRQGGGVVSSDRDSDRENGEVSRGTTNSSVLAI